MGPLTPTLQPVACHLTLIFEGWGFPGALESQADVVGGFQETRMAGGMSRPGIQTGERAPGL